MQASIPVASNLTVYFREYVAPHDPGSHIAALSHIQWNLNITKGQETGKICLL